MIVNVKALLFYQLCLNIIALHSARWDHERVRRSNQTEDSNFRVTNTMRRPAKVITTYFSKNGRGVTRVTKTTSAAKRAAGKLWLESFGGSQHRCVAQQDASSRKLSFFVHFLFFFWYRWLLVEEFWRSDVRCSHAESRSASIDSHEEKYLTGSNRRRARSSRSSYASSTKDAFAVYLIWWRSIHVICFEFHAKKSKRWSVWRSIALRSESIRWSKTLERSQLIGFVGVPNFQLCF